MWDSVVQVAIVQRFAWLPVNRSKVGRVKHRWFGTAAAYLLIFLTGATGALLVLAWLLRNILRSEQKTGRETFRGLRSAAGFGSGGTSSV